MSSLCGRGSKGYMTPAVKEKKSEVCKGIAKIMERCVTEKQIVWDSMLEELDDYIKSLSPIKAVFYSRVAVNHNASDKTSSEICKRYTELIRKYYSESDIYESRFHDMYIKKNIYLLGNRSFTL